MRPGRLLIALTALPLAACAPLDRTSGNRALTGTAVGAAAGAAVGLLSGGLVYDQMKKGGH